MATKFKYFAIEPLMIEAGERIEPKSGFNCPDDLGLKLVGNGSAETAEMHEARAAADEEVLKAEAKVEKAKMAASKARLNRSGVGTSIAETKADPETKADKAKG